MYFKKIAFAITALVAFYFWYTNESLPTVEQDIEVATHEQWDVLLKKHVDRKGFVDYKGFKEDAASLNLYLGYLTTHYPTKNWNKTEKLAYYINLYNAATVKLIIDNYPTNSIKDINLPWLKKRVLIGDKKWSLGGIEHKILRKMKEPRIHFAINCASYSCPRLLNEAYTSQKMESQLQTATLGFLKDTTLNKISNQKLQLSRIFKWYEKDFKENGSLINYIDTVLKQNLSKNLPVTYLEYNWNLNEKN